MGAHSALSAAEHVLVRVTLSDGTVGQAEATPRPTIYGETTASVLGILAQLEAGLTGVAITDEVGLNRVRNSVVNNHTARGALDMALHDARARAQESPCSTRCWARTRGCGPVSSWGSPRRRCWPRRGAWWPQACAA